MSQTCVDQEHLFYEYNVPKQLEMPVLDLSTMRPEFDTLQGVSKHH